MCCFLLQQGGPCELEFTGQNGLVVLNEKRISPGDKVSLIGGDELIFGANDAYVSLLSDSVPCISFSFVCPYFIYWLLVGTSGMVEYARLVSLTCYRGVIHNPLADFSASSEGY
jgi:hypothetical protein